MFLLFITFNEDFSSVAGKEPESIPDDTEWALPALEIKLKIQSFEFRIILNSKAECIVELCEVN